jgi:hypothetical protein
MMRPAVVGLITLITRATAATAIAARVMHATILNGVSYEVGVEKL